MITRKITLIIAVYSLTGTALALFNYVIWKFPVDTTPSQFTPDATAQKHDIEPSDVDWSAKFQNGEALLRPLFHPSRREYVAPPPEIKAQEIPSPLIENPGAQLPQNLRFIGTRLLNGTRAALVEIRGNEPNWITVGDVFNTWIVASVTDTKLVFSQGQQLVELDLYHD